MTIREASLIEAVDAMRTAGYDDDQFVDRFATWLARGDAILVFDNHDLGSLVSHGIRVALPHDPATPIPRQLGDNTAAGPGWRWLPTLIVHPNTGGTE